MFRTVKQWDEGEGEDFSFFAPWPGGYDGTQHEVTEDSVARLAHLTGGAEEWLLPVDKLAVPRCDVYVGLGRTGDLGMGQWSDERGRGWWMLVGAYGYQWEEMHGQRVLSPTHINHWQRQFPTWQAMWDFAKGLPLDLRPAHLVDFVLTLQWDDITTAP